MAIFNSKVWVYQRVFWKYWIIILAIYWEYWFNGIFSGIIIASFVLIMRNSYHGVPGTPSGVIKRGLANETVILISNYVDTFSAMQLVTTMRGPQWCLLVYKPQ